VISAMMGGAWSRPRLSLAHNVTQSGLRMTYLFGVAHPLLCGLLVWDR
jgi:hypothetical protein